MKTFLTSLSIIIITVILLFAVTLLLDVPFIQAYVVRRVLVYLIMAIILFIGLRLVVLANNTP